jgi:hypothetical protein
LADFREPTPDELSVVELKIAELRQAICGNHDSGGIGIDVLGWAYYEGYDKLPSALQVMVSSAPYVVGEALVKQDEFKWVMVAADESWHHGVIHPLLAEPIDLLTLEDGSWHRPDDENDEPPRPGETTLESYEFIVLAVEWKRVAGRDVPIPAGNLRDIEQALKRFSRVARVRGPA